MAYGQEMLVDEGRAVARRMEKQGVAVRWWEWEVMPHCFAIVLEAGGDRGSAACFERWAGFCGGCVEGGVQGRGEARKGVWVEAGTGREREVPVGGEGRVWGDEEVWEMMREARGRRERGEEGEAKIMPRL